MTDKNMDTEKKAMDGELDEQALDSVTGGVIQRRKLPVISFEKSQDEPEETSAKTTHVPIKLKSPIRR